MAVTIEIADRWKECISCGSEDNVIYITVLRRVGKCQQGTQIALCESCAQTLRLALNNRYKGYMVRDDG